MKFRQSNIEKLKSEPFDVLIVGGGINGSVAAAALSGKGARVALVDKGDFASVTSQESSNLAWGGIKYLESYEFGLVWGLCASRNKLITSFPSQVKEVRFYTTIAKGFRKPRFLIYLGSLLYWGMGRFFTKAPRLLTRSTIEAEQPIINLDNSVGGLEYSDSYFIDNDARFVFKFIRRSLDQGCVAANYVEEVASKKDAGDLWVTSVQDNISGEKFDIKSKIVINASGPYADNVNKLNDVDTANHHILSKGVHLIVDKIIPDRKVLTFFADDGRLFFVIPMGPKSCIGTTDTPVKAMPPVVTDEDREFILDNINKRLNLAKPLTKDDVIAERCGVRPLVVKKSSNQEQGDWVSLSRKHVLEIDKSKKSMTIFGGKLTDCINVGEEMVDAVADLGVEFPHPDAQWYGEPGPEVKSLYKHQAKLLGLDEMTHTTSSEKLTSRLWRRYGARAFEILEEIRQDPSMADLLIEGAEYIKAELYFTEKFEMVTKLEDFLRRRSKIALIARKRTIKNAPGMKQACEILFGDKAKEKYDEYFND